MIATGVSELSQVVGTSAACIALAVSRATHYRRDRGPRLGPPALRPRPARALSENERTTVLDLLHAERFVDASPAATYATLLDEGTYLASERTMYRILAGADEVRERRAQRRHPVYARPELLATGPNELWSWDITKLKGPAKWTTYQLYVILDVFSRYVPGWMVAHRESAILAQRLIEETTAKQAIVPGSLTVHADRGTSMRSKPVALLLADLGITRSHSRPHVSDDNPYSEAQFKTLKYRPGFPERFGSIEDARAFCQGSSPGTTPSTATAGSRCSPQPTFITVGRTSCSKLEPASWPVPTRSTPSASCGANQRPDRFPPRSGSTGPRRR